MDVTAENARLINCILADCLSSLGGAKDRTSALHRSRDVVDTTALVARLYLHNARLDYTPLNFERVLNKYWGRELVAEEIERQIAAAENPGYLLLKRAAAIYAPSKCTRARAIELLFLAEKQLPKGSQDEAKSFYALLVDTLIEAGKTQEAIAAQRRRIAATGDGEIRLALLEHQAGQKSRLTAIATKMDARTASDKDIRELAMYCREAAQPDLYVPLLLGYLRAGRERDVACDLWARRCLASYYAKRKEWEKAFALLQVEDIACRARTHEARVERRRVQMMRRNIATMMREISQ
jgi:hypothetical protein